MLKTNGFQLRLLPFQINPLFNNIFQDNSRLEWTAEHVSEFATIHES